MIDFTFDGNEKIKLIKIYELTLYRELEITKNSHVGTTSIALKIKSPQFEDIAFDIKECEIRGGVGNALLYVFQLFPKDLFADGTKIKMDCLIENNGKYERNIIPILPQFEIEENK